MNSNIFKLDTAKFLELAAKHPASGLNQFQGNAKGSTKRSILPLELNKDYVEHPRGILLSWVGAGKVMSVIRAAGLKIQEPDIVDVYDDWVNACQAR